MTEEQYEQLFGEKWKHHTVSVYNREDFEEAFNKKVFSIDKDAIIEIYTSPKGTPVIPYNIINNHKDNIIALDFDDFPEDVIFPDSTYTPPHPTITYEQAELLVDFIERNVKEDRDFYIHCDAGVSRSQQVAAYIFLTHGWFYNYDENKSSHPYHLAHTIVVSRLLEVKHRTHPDFTNSDNRMIYDKKSERWIEKS